MAYQQVYRLFQRAQAGQVLRWQHHQWYHVKQGPLQLAHHHEVHFMIMKKRLNQTHKLILYDINDTIIFIAFHVVAGGWLIRVYIER
jgi:hypothetical protein